MTGPRGKKTKQTLSGREKQIMAFLMMGDSPKTVADKACLSIKTVSTYVARIKEKLGLDDPRDLWLYGVLSGATPVPERIQKLLDKQGVAS